MYTVYMHARGNLILNLCGKTNSCTSQFVCPTHVCSYWIPGNTKLIYHVPVLLPGIQYISAIFTASYLKLHAIIYYVLFFLFLRIYMFKYVINVTFKSYNVNSCCTRYVYRCFLYFVPVWEILK